MRHIIGSFALVAVLATAINVFLDYKPKLTSISVGYDEADDRQARESLARIMAKMRERD